MKMAIDAPALVGTKSGRLQEVLYELLTGSLHAGSGAIPTSVRFLFYELVQAGHVEKRAGARRPDQDVSDALMVLRRTGRIPWDWIRDETRRLQVWALYSPMAERTPDATQPRTAKAVKPWPLAEVLRKFEHVSQYPSFRLQHYDMQVIVASLRAAIEAEERLPQDAEGLDVERLAEAMAVHGISDGDGLPLFDIAEKIAAEYAATQPGEGE